MVVSQDNFNYVGFQRVFGNLLLNLKFRTISQKLYNLVFILRRIIASVALDLKNYSGQQLQLIMLTNLLYLIYIGKTEPFVERSANNLAIANEYAIGILVYFFVIFTLFCPNK